ncbi:hypothetical protein Fot_10801 [Forsythia ovata]|uniref:Uncharacterized protein n=1 Tax=Forsythia ovata TaxID=205694 RepID=A0ABD1WHV1_9LAMI
MSIMITLILSKHTRRHYEEGGTDRGGILVPLYILLPMHLGMRECKHHKLRELAIRFAHYYQKITDPKHVAAIGPIQWTKNGKTKVQSVEEDNRVFLFSTYQIASFADLHLHMDNYNEIDVLGVVIDVLPKKIVQTKYNSESCIQELVLVNEKADDNMEFLDNLVSSKTYLSSKSLQISHPPPEKIVQIQDIPHLLNGGNQNILNTIRTYTTKEHFLYLKAMKNSNKGTNMRYDVIFMLDPVLDTEITANEGELPVNDVILEENKIQPPENNISYSSVKDAQP